MNDLSRREFVVRATAAAALPAAVSACRSQPPAAPVPQPAAVPAAPPVAPAPAVDWGFPPDALRVGLNENPLGPSPRALEAMAAALRQGHRYPLSSALQQALARHHGVEPAWVLLGCGSTELLRNLPHAYCGAGGEVVSARESYRELPLESLRLGLKTHLVPAGAAGAHDLAAMARAVNGRTRVVCLTNPNNPTGSTLTREAVAGFARVLPREVVLCLDEAYIQFAPELDSSGLVGEQRNLLVLRTFSKIHGLAGMRVGYALGHPDLLKPLRCCALRYPVNVAGYTGALAALGDTAHQDRTRALRDEAQSYFARELKALDLEMRVGPTPFVLIRGERDGVAMVRALLAQRVYTRPGRDWDLPDWFRMSYGTMADNRAVLAALKRVLEG